MDPENNTEKKEISIIPLAEGIGGFLALAIPVSLFVGIDYLMSNSKIKSTYMMTGRVEEVVDVYKKFGSRGRFITQGDGFSAWVGSQVQKGLNIGNNEIGYIISPQTVSYSTKGGFLFKSKVIESNISGLYGQTPIISDVKLEGIVAGSIVEFEPSTDMSIGELVTQGRPKSLSVNSGEYHQKYESVIYHPPKFSKVR